MTEEFRAELEEFIAAAERLTAAAKALIHPGAVSPAKARLMVYPCPGPEGARVITAHPVS